MTDGSASASHRHRPAAEEIAADALARARRRGAEAADAVFVRSAALSCARRLGNPESLERAESAEVGLRILFGRRQAVASTSDLTPAGLDALAERVAAMARAVPEDPYAGLAEPGEIARTLPDLDLAAAENAEAETLARWASEAEAAARAVRGVTNSEGAEASFSRTEVALAASNGFAGAYAVTRVSLSVSVIAGEGTGMERDWEFASANHPKDLPSPANLGARAGERAVRRLGPRKIASATLPVIYDRRVAGGLIGHLASAVNGQAVARGTTFLKEKLGQRVFAPGIRIVDDPLRRRGLRSRPFDGEGVAAAPLDLIADGVLKSWVLDLRTARQLGLATTGRASRGTASPPAPATTNLYLAPGGISRDALIKDVKRGFLITELIGMGVSTVTGDYSRGAGGFWIEDGALAHPVSEVTVAGNLKDIFARLEPADDLEFQFGTDAPSVRVDGMAVAGR